MCNVTTNILYGVCTKRKLLPQDAEENPPHRNLKQIVTYTMLLFYLKTLLIKCVKC